MWPFNSGGYKVLAEAKQKERDGALSAAPKFTGSVAEHGAFLRATASEIVSRIERGEWTASQVVSAYIAQSVLAQQTTNCVTEGKSIVQSSSEQLEFLRLGRTVLQSCSPRPCNELRNSMLNSLPPNSCEALCMEFP